MRKNESKKYSVIKYKGLEEKCLFWAFSLQELVVFMMYVQKNIYKKYRIIYNAIMNY